MLGLMSRITPVITEGMGWKEMIELRFQLFLADFGIFIIILFVIIVINIIAFLIDGRK